MQINIDLSQEDERILKARYLREGIELEADMTSWVLSQVRKEKTLMEQTGATIAQIETVANAKAVEREQLKQEQIEQLKGVNNAKNNPDNK